MSGIFSCSVRIATGQSITSSLLSSDIGSDSNDESPAQVAMRARLEAAGYRCVVAYGADDAIDAIENYLRMQ